MIAASRATRLGIASLCLVVALLAGVAAAAGVFARGSGATAAAVSVRGEHFEYATDGVYRYNAQRVVAEGVGWDIFTLFVAVPALLLAVPRLARGSFRATLFALGLLGYFFYQYLMYAMTWAFGPLFLLFVVIYASGLAAIVWILSTIPFEGLERRFTDRFPARGMAILSAAMALVLTLMWLQRILAGLRGDYAAAMLLGGTTMVVQGLDLGLIVPLSLWTGHLAWRRRPVGYLLCSVFVVKAVAMALAICAMLLSAWAVEGRLDIGGFALFGTVAAVSLWLGARMYGRGLAGV